MFNRLNLIITKDAQASRIHINAVEIVAGYKSPMKDKLEKVFNMRCYFNSPKLGPTNSMSLWGYIMIQMLIHL